MSRSRDDVMPRRDFRARRWLTVVLRTVHLVSVIALGALVLGAAPSPDWSHARVAVAVVVSGLAMLALDLYAHPSHLRTVAGLTSVAKLVLVAFMALGPAALLFWAVVVLSTVISHAPATFRHRRLIPSRTGASPG